MEPSQPIDLTKINVPNSSKTAINPIVYEKGLSTELALNRLLYRLNHAELNLQKRKQNLAEGNLAQIEPEIYAALTTVQDFVDICRELASLTYVSIQQIRNALSPDFQKEQGVAPPLNP